MILRRLVVENIRSHVRTETEFKEGITVFTGRTGSGKSSLLIAIEYALFGADVIPSNAALLRRGSNAGKVILEFDHMGSNYRVRRGLKRFGRNILSDSENLKLFKDDKEIEVFGRASDLNEKIIEILGYPKDIKPKDLFEVTSYTKQDEIRKLIELRPELRQEYIDRILQLSRYKNAWENLRGVIERFKLRLKEKEVRAEAEEGVATEIQDIKQKLREIEQMLEGKRAQLDRIEEDYLRTREELLELRGREERVLSKKSEYDEKVGRCSVLEREIGFIKKDLEVLRFKMADLRKKVEEIEVPELEELQVRKGQLEQEKLFLQQEMKKFEGELRNIKEIKEAICPLCGQEITEAHKEHILQDRKTKIEERKAKIEQILKEEKELLPKLNLAQESRKLREELKRCEEILAEREARLKLRGEEKESMLQEIEKLKKEIEVWDEIRAEKILVEKRWEELSSKRSSLLQALSFLKDQIDDLKKRLKEREKRWKEIQAAKEALGKLRSLVDLLARLRGDIRNIREVVRNKFLEDFREEFQRKWEEIRRWEEEYSVDVKQNYEAIAYTSDGEEVPVENLSGGEKTSIALSYRLALADIAARIGGIKESEILILDEPTLGFDREDIKALPEALRNIRTIPQIIIVTHEEELKQAADFKYEIRKVNGVSKVSLA